MPLPTSWADHLFAKLGVRYGAAFLRQWTDTDPALVKADWAEVLDGTSGDAIGYALRNLPDRPMNATQFRDLCRRAPVAATQALPAPDVKADPSRLAEILGRLHEPATERMTPAERCAKAILTIAAGRGGVVTVPQRQQLVAMGWSEEGGAWVRRRPLGMHEDAAA